MAVVKRILIIFGVIAVIVLAAWLLLHPNTAKAPATNQSTSKNSSASSTTSSGFDKKHYSIDDPASIWVVVNKQRALKPTDYVPTDLTTPNVPLRVPGNETMRLRQETVSNVDKLFSGAKQQGLNLMVSSGYRSYTYQVSLYNSYVSQSGQVAADKGSARPGHSEHQTGLAADLEPVSKKCELDACFANTPEGQWLAANAYKYGFIIRYPADKVAVTGYEYEPWHVRYVGTDLATEMHRQNIETLEEFFGLPAAPYY